MPARYSAQRGVSALVFLVTLVITLGGIMAAIDLARIQLAQGRLQSALDSAVEAATRRFGSAPGAEWEREINAWMQANHDVPFTLNVSRSPDRISATANHNLRLLSAGFLSFDSTTAGVHAQSGAPLSSGRRLEVVVALDTYTPPYSEVLDFRARAARQAAQQLIEALLPDEPDPNIRVGLIPFADTVKPVDPVDKAQSRKLNGWLHNFWHPWLETWITSTASANPWAGCVTERGLHIGGTAPPQPPVPPNLRAEPGIPGQLAPLFIPHSLSLSPLDANPLNWPARITPGSVPIARTPYGVTVGISGQRQLDVWLSTRAPNCVDMPAMTNLTDSKKAFGSTFGKLLPVKLGAEASMQPLGLLWAWRMLDPAWRNGLWASTDSATAETQKVIVLVSLGTNAPHTTSKTFPGPDIPGSFDVEYKFQRCTTIWCTSYESTSRSESIRVTGPTRNISVAANTLNSLAAPHSAPDPSINPSNATHLNGYTRALCSALNATGSRVKLYTVVVQPLLARVDLPCAMPGERTKEVFSWSQSQREQAVRELASGILEAYRDPYAR